MNVRLKKLTADDVYGVVQWTNNYPDSYVRQPKFTTERFFEWYTSYITTPRDHMYIVVAEGTRVGTIGVRVDTWEINRVILGEPLFRRMGVMSAAINGLMHEYGSHTYTVRIPAHNKEAVKFFEHNGFSTQDKADSMIIMFRHYTVRRFNGPAHTPEVPGDQGRSGDQPLE